MSKISSSWRSVRLAVVLAMGACGDSSSDQPAPQPGVEAGACTGSCDAGVYTPAAVAEAGIDAAATTDAAPDTGSKTGGNFPPRYVAPYVATWHDTDLVALSNGTGNKLWTLAFVIPETGGACKPSWNGYQTLTENKYGEYIDALRAIGGDVIVSFGGADGGELGKACATVAEAQAAYQEVIDAFHLTYLDFDIESGLQGDTESIDRRNQALANLQAANPGLRISYTLGVERTGMLDGQKNVLKSAKANGVVVDVVNGMAMDYGPCYTDMGQAAIESATAMRDQLTALGITASVGVTPMIGKNDVECEVFSTTDAQLLVDFAQTSSFIKMMAYWKENGTASDPPVDFPTNSYIDIFKTFH